MREAIEMWTLRVDHDDDHEELYVVNQALFEADTDHNVTVYLSSEDIVAQTVLLIDWLNHIAPDGVLPNLPDDDEREATW